MARYIGQQPRVSGNRVDGGTITNFSSTGIDDNATSTKVTVTDSQLQVAVNLINSASSGTHTFNTDSFVFDVTNDRLGIGVATPSAMLDLSGYQTIHTWYDDTATNGPDISLKRVSASPTTGDSLGCVRFFGRNSAAEDVVYAKVTTKIIDTTDGAEKGELDLSVMKDGTVYSALKITDDQFIVNDGQESLDVIIRGVSDDELLHIDTYTSRIGVGTDAPEKKLHIVGDVKIDGTITFSDTASGAGNPTFVIQDEINSGSSAYAALELQDSTALNMAAMSLYEGKMHITSQHSTDGSSGIHFGLGYTTSSAENYEYMMMMEESGAETTILTGSANISFNNTAGTISSSNSGDFSSLAVSDVIVISGAVNSANNRSWRITAKTGDTLTVIDRRGNKPTTETGGSITVKKHANFVKIPDTVDHYTWTAPQSTNSQIVASTAYVRTAIANLIDSSPAALDTLDELAAALGDDENFATTITNALALKTNTDFDNLSATGIENLRDYIGPYVAGGTGTIQGAGNTITVTNDDAENNIDIDIVLNDPTLGVTLTGGDVTGSGTATMTDLQDTTISFAASIATGVIKAHQLYNVGTGTGYSGVENILYGLETKATVSNDDWLMLSDSADSFKLKKVKKSVAVPPAFSEDLGFFSIAMA